MQKYHRAKFEITPRGKKSKYYTCSVCGFRCWAFVAKDAHGQHKAHLTPLAPDSSKAGVLSLPESVKVENALPAVSG